MLRFPVAQKIAAGYVLVSMFCLAGVIYALTALNYQTRLNQDLVRVDFALLGLVRDMRTNLLAQERLERQLLILRDARLTELWMNRLEEFSQIHRQLVPIIPSDDQHLSIALREASQVSHQARVLMENDQWEDAGAFSQSVLSPQRNRLIGQLEQYLQRREQAMDLQLHSLLEQSRRAYRLTLTLAFGGLILAALVGVWGSYRIHQAVRRLTSATKDIACGNFDAPVALSTRDEFGQLARDFHEMGQKLKELDKLRLDANPLTHLPGNLALEREMEVRLARNLPFATIYVDLDHFKAFNDRYGYKAGSDVLARVGELARQALDHFGGPEDMVGHIGGDDYILLSTPQQAEAIAQELIRSFDELVPSFYSEEDRSQGYFVGKDRFDVERRFTLLTMSIAIVTSSSLKNPSPVAIGRECAKIKDHLKKVPGSNYLVDRREQR
jgi:GGDEF domain-containing protein/CHASE3 domain sensor protein